MSRRCCGEFFGRGEAAKRVLHHVDAGATMRGVNHQPHPAAGGEDRQQGAQALGRVRQMVQHAAAFYVVERPQPGMGQVEQRPLFPDDVGQPASLGTCLGDCQGGGGAIQPGHLSGAPEVGHLLRQHDGPITGAPAGEQRVQRLGCRTGGAEHPVVDFPDVAWTADDEPFRFVPGVPPGVGKGLVLAGEALVGCVGHGAGIAHDRAMRPAFRWGAGDCTRGPSPSGGSPTGSVAARE